jgi:MFS family permease
LGLARVIPIVLFALLGGMVADTYNRRKLLLIARTLGAVLAGILAIVTLTGSESVLPLYLVTAAIAGVNAFGNPARQSMIPNLVAREHLTNAVSLFTLMFQISTILGPALAGVLIAQYDIGFIYLINAISFLFTIAALLMISYPHKPEASSGIGWQQLRDGLHFTFHTRLIWSTMLLDFLATFFSSAQTMLPIVADDILRVGVQGYGLLATAQPIGAVIAGMFMALRKDIQRQGLVLLSAITVYGAATALFGLSSFFALSYVLYALTGAGDTISTVIRNTIRQSLTPDNLRGRMTSVNMIFFMGGPQLGELEAGVLAAFFGVPFAIVSGGVATVLLTLWIAWKYPQLRNYTSPAAS